jgi:hypothetical protein
MNKTELQIAVTNRTIPLTDLIARVDSLSTDDRVALLKHLLKEQSISAVFGYQSSDLAVFQQLNQMSSQQLGEALKVIAFRIAKA